MPRDAHLRSRRRSRVSTQRSCATLPSKTILLGVLDLGADEVETPEVVAARIRARARGRRRERLVVAPDCGMKYLPRERALRKLEAMVAGAELAVGA